MCICSKLTIKTPVTPSSSVSIVNFEHENAGWIPTFGEQFDPRIVILTLLFQRCFHFIFRYSLTRRICTDFKKIHDAGFAMILCTLQCKRWLLGEKMYMKNAWFLFFIFFLLGWSITDVSLNRCLIGHLFYLLFFSI